MISRYEIEKHRNKWVLRVLSTFVIVVAILFIFDKAIEHYGLSEEYLRVGALVLGAIYLFSIFSYKNIRCSNCRQPIFNHVSIMLPLPKECKKCNKAID